MDGNALLAQFIPNSGQTWLSRKMYYPETETGTFFMRGFPENVSG